MSKLIRAMGVALLIGGALMVPSTYGEEAEYEMGQFQFVMLMTGEAEPPSSEDESAKMQAAHLEFLEKLSKDRRALAVGPIADGGDFRGVVVLDVGSVDKAQQLMATDPWVQAGVLRADVHGWWAAKGILQEPPRFLDLETTHLGLLMRPKEAPDYDEKKLAALQEGHMANMNVMAEAGELVIAGPMAADTPLRGLVWFRTQDSALVREMMDKDPSIEAGRLEVQLYELSLPKGTLPPR